MRNNTCCYNPGLAQSRFKSAFTLIELSVVLIIIATILGGSMSLLIASTQSAQYNSTVNTMDAIEAALLNYSAANGRIPCPADLTIAPGGNYYGREAGYHTGGIGTGECQHNLTPAANFATAATGGTAEGGVPTRALNLPDSYMYDGWGHKFRYVVDPTYTVSNTSRSSWPIPGNLCTTSSTGITVNDASGNSRTTAAIYAIISHGANGHGGYTSSGIAVNTGSANANEQTNCHCDATAAHTGGATTLSSATYVQKIITPDPVTPLNSFDDIIAYKEGWQLQTAGNQITTACLNYLYVVDSSGGSTKVWIYNFRTKIWGSISASPAFNWATGVATDSSGNIYVIEFAANQVRKYTASTATWNNTFITGLNGPLGIYIDNSSNNIYITDYNGPTPDVRKFNSAGVQQGAPYTDSFNGPAYGIPDASGNIWVSDTGNNTLKKYNGTVWSTVSGPGGGLSGPQVIFPDANGNIWVADAGHNEIWKYTPGSSSWGSPITASSPALNNPELIAIDTGGNIWVGDSGNELIREYSNGQWTTLVNLTTLSASFTVSGIWVQ